MGKPKINRPAESTLPVKALEVQLAHIARMGVGDLRGLWRSRFGQSPPKALTKDLIARALCHDLQERALGGLSRRLQKRLTAIAAKGAVPARQLKVGSTILREHQGLVHEVVVVPEGFLWSGQTYASLSIIARKITGTRWKGPKFFGVDSCPEEIALPSAQWPQPGSRGDLEAEGALAPSEKFGNPELGS